MGLGFKVDADGKKIMLANGTRVAAAARLSGDSAFFETFTCVGSIEINARCVGNSSTMRKGEAPVIESKSRCDHASHPRIREMGDQLRFPVSVAQMI